MRSEYIRPSCAYWVMNGLTAARSAATQAVRVPKSSRPPHQATGTHSTASSTERPWTAASLLPATCSQRLSSR